jgi:hypothetical protein
MEAMILLSVMRLKDYLMKEPSVPLIFILRVRGRRFLVPLTTLTP